MSAAIKRMLAERARVTADRCGDTYRVEAGFERGTYAPSAWDRNVGDVFAMIDRAAPFMDEGADPREWPPSAKMKILICIVATGPNNHAKNQRRTVLLVLDLLERARQMWIAGYVPDPWAKEPRLLGS